MLYHGKQGAFIKADFAPWDATRDDEVLPSPLCSAGRHSTHAARAQHARHQNLHRHRLQAQLTRLVAGSSPPARCECHILAVVNPTLSGVKRCRSVIPVLRKPLEGSAVCVQRTLLFCQVEATFALRGQRMPPCTATDYGIAAASIFAASAPDSAWRCDIFTLALSTAWLGH